jgi:hypothetical protein
MGGRGIRGGEQMNKNQSGFGKCLTMFLQDRGYKRKRQLLRALEEKGFDCKSAQNLSNWFNGRHAPPEFVQAVAKLLDLNEEEEFALYRSYVWDSREPLETYLSERNRL